MQSADRNPALARNHRGRAVRSARSTAAIFLIAAGSTLLATGCASGSGGASPPDSLVTGRRAAPLPTAQLASATAAAETFADAYAPTVYLRRPPLLPGTTASVRRTLRLAAARVPRSRMKLRPSWAGLGLKLAGPGRVDADLRIVDGRSPDFSVGFTLTRTGAGWRVTSVSPPG